MTNRRELIAQLRKPWTDVGHWQELGEKAADALEAEQCAVVKPLTEEDRAEISEAAYMAMRKSQRGAQGQLMTEWDSIDSYIIVETERRILSAITIRPAAEVAAEVIEAAKSVVGAMLPENGAGEPQDDTDRLIDATRRSCIREIDAIHTDATRAALKRMKGGE